MPVAELAAAALAGATTTTGATEYDEANATSTVPEPLLAEKVIVPETSEPETEADEAVPPALADPIVLVVRMCPPTVKFPVETAPVTARSPPVTFKPPPAGSVTLVERLDAV
jgi:hypothetical protein